MSDDTRRLAQLHDLVDVGSGEEVLQEVGAILLSIDSGFDLSFQKELYEDIASLFEGRYPGYRRSNTGYHDLEHTRSVYLASARLMHGYVLDGNSLSHLQMNLGLASALFHDVGLIQKSTERKGTGARFTVGHEVRSARFATRYLKAHGFSPEDAVSCDHIIECTSLDLDFPAIPFANDAVKQLGRLVGTADLLAQMADRMYLEKLLLLFLEFKEAKINNVSSEIEMLNNTREFYENLVLRRFSDDFAGADKYELIHFEQRWKVSKGLYKEAIQANLDYLDAILASGENGYRRFLRRGGIVQRLAPEDETT